MAHCSVLKERPAQGPQRAAEAAFKRAIPNQLEQPKEGPLLSLPPYG